MRFLFLLICCLPAFGQQRYDVSQIPDSLTANANAVVRLEQVSVDISSRSNILIKTTRVVTVFNESGLKCTNAAEYRPVNSISATVYDAAGKKIKDFARKDFKTTGASDSFITDNITTYLDYTPTVYPFTIVYQSTVSDNNTAFIPPWQPLSDYFCSVERSDFTITAPADLGLKYKLSNPDNSVVSVVESAGMIRVSAQGLPAVKQEQYAPGLDAVSLMAYFGLDRFHLEGVDGEAKSWENFSSWMYTNLLLGTDELSDQTKAHVKALVGSETDPLKKARIIYEYVQSKTRYVSIQLGIGGWKPMKAKDVDRLGYGDCKALTNYTRALLDLVGVKSYYAVVYGDQTKRSLQEDFVSMQGNHVILGIPIFDNWHWLECTNQKLPFGFLGDFTDDRLVLPVRPQGGKLVRTTSYKTEGNLQTLSGSFALDAAGTASGSVVIVSTGIQYDNKMRLADKPRESLSDFYKNYFSTAPNLKLDNIKLVNEKEKPAFREEISLKSERYASVAGNRMIFPVNLFNVFQTIPKRYRDRSQPLTIARGFTDHDEVEFEIPDGFSVEAVPAKQTLQGKFGVYELEVVPVSGRKFLLKRKLTIREGRYAAAEYDEYRKFSEQVAKADASKMVIVKI